MSCPVCGHPEGACTGATRTRERQIITADGVRTAGPAKVPRIHSRVGRAGYVGEGTSEIEVYEPKLPHIRFVQESDEPPAEDDEPAVEEEKPKRRRKKADA